MGVISCKSHSDRLAGGVPAGGSGDVLSPSCKWGEKDIVDIVVLLGSRRGVAHRRHCDRIFDSGSDAGFGVVCDVLDVFSGTLHICITRRLLLSRSNEIPARRKCRGQSAESVTEGTRILRPVFWLDVVLRSPRR